MLGVKRNLRDDSDDDEKVVLSSIDNSNNNNNNNNNNEVDSNSSNSKKKFKKDNNVISFEKKVVSNIRYINITSSSGQRISKKINLDNINSKTKQDSTTIHKSNSGDSDLLGKPFKEILKELEDFESIKIKSRLLIENEKKNQVINNNNNNSNSSSNSSNNKLWVDKYSPQSFHDLLSDDSMNIEILKWLKLWDGIVFGKEIKKDLVMPSSVALSQLSSGIGISTTVHNYQNQLNNQLNNQFKSSSSSSSTINKLNPNQQQQQHHYLLQEDGTPIVKVILLTGGPGLGKTTLAHVLARHAGYDTVEINASEDRSGEAFESKLLASIENNTSAFDKKPNCLIIDEIDGISGRDNGPIELICKLIENSLKSGASKKSNSSTTAITKKKQQQQDDEEEDESDIDEEEEFYNNNNNNNNTIESNKKKSTNSKSKTSKKKKFTSRLLRPIICICNDQYVPSLRKLRQKSTVFNFSAPKKPQLLSRLKEICLNENLTANDSTLSSLIDMTGSDIRACINSLQFIKSKTSVLNSDLLKNKSNIVIGQKDIEKGLFEIWNLLFKNQINSNKSILSSSSSSSSNNNSSNKINNLESYQQLNLIIESCNQIDKLMDGVHENYLTNISSDYNLDKTVDCLDWMGFSDIIQHDERYKSIVPLAIHQRCTTFTPKIVMPHSEYDNYIKKKSTTTIKESFYSDAPASVHCNLKKNLFTVDFVYPFIDIISLPIRVSNTQLYSIKEKNNLNNLIETMKHYHITYKLEKSNYNNTSKDNQNKIQYKLEPPIDQLLTFQNQQQFNKYDKSNSYTSANNGNNQNIQPIKHIKLSNEQKQIITIALQQYKPPKKDQDKEKEKEKLDKPTPTTAKDHFKQPSTPAKPLAPQVLKDFFGRVIQTSPEQKRALSGDNNGPHIKYKFQEGFTNAIKKPVTLKEFL